MRLLVDTNILVDHLLDRRPFSEPASLLIALGRLREFELWMSASQITDVFYILSDGGKAARALMVRAALRRMREAVRVCALLESDVDATLDSPWDDFEDACVHQCALKIKADAIITRNQEDFARSSIKVFDCDELFAYLRDEKGLDYGFVTL